MVHLLYDQSIFPVGLDGYMLCTVMSAKVYVKLYKEFFEKMCISNWNPGEVGAYQKDIMLMSMMAKCGKALKIFC